MSNSVQQLDCEVLVVNKHRSSFDVAVDRHYGRGMDEQELGDPGCFGNPYKVGEDGDRQEVVEKFAKYFIGQWQRNVELREYWVEKVREHEQLRLGCHCAPKDCHGDVIKEVVEEAIVGVDG